MTSLTLFEQVTAAAKSLQSCPNLCDSVRLHRQQPTRLCRPWDSPGKNTEVGCHFLLQCMKVKSGSEVTQSCLTLCYQPTKGVSFPWSVRRSAHYVCSTLIISALCS